MIATAAALALAGAIPARMPPVDQCQGDRAFSEFRRTLMTAVADRNMESLLKLMSDDVRVSFGGGVGKEEFRRYWARHASESKDLWSELANALKLGCGMKSEARVFPSMFAQADDLDEYETRIALPGARLRRTPSMRGAIVGRLSWHVLQLDGLWTGGEWIPVRLRDGRRGYVHKTAARSPIDYRLVAHKRDGRWLITAFVAGD
jgi:hypothetical protein